MTETGPRLWHRLAVASALSLSVLAVILFVVDQRRRSAERSQRSYSVFIVSLATLEYFREKQTIPESVQTLLNSGNLVEWDGHIDRQRSYGIAHAKHVRSVRIVIDEPRAKALMLSDHAIASRPSTDLLVASIDGLSTSDIMEFNQAVVNTWLKERAERTDRQ